MTRVAKPRSRSGGGPTLLRILFVLALCVLSFFAGTIWGAHVCLDGSLAEADGSSLQGALLQAAAGYVDVGSTVKGQRQGGGGGGGIGGEMQEKESNEEKQADDQGRRAEEEGGASTTTKNEKCPREKQRRIPDSMKRIAHGIARTNKDEFTKLYDFGIPYDRQKKDGLDMLLLYQNEKAIPRKIKDKAIWDTGDGIPMLSAAEATASCDGIDVIMTQPQGNYPQCIAIMANFPSYHIQRWLRTPPSGPLNHALPLRAVSRGDADNGRHSYKSPRLEKDIRATMEMLRTYLNSLDDVLAELRPIAEKVAKDNTIIVMTCNFGQSELLMNFACSAKSRGFDISNILVFATDEETKELAEGLGLATFYDAKNFESVPSDAARRYGDQRFVAMMFAKVVCVQLVSLIGYDILFQDVDIVWYKNPLEYFHDKTSAISHFDVYFQDDGAHSLRYAPFSANSGFYYVRNNEKTRYLFTSLLYQQDIIRRTESHQQALIALLNEHSSLFGLRIKVLNRDEDEFPGGWHYHHSGMSTFMRRFVKGEVSPYIFHMSWTNNKVNKIKFFQQMGDWYLSDKCIAKPLKEIIAGDASTEPNLSKACCLAEPAIKCHYRDKPSKIPCKDSPPIDKGKPAWWK